MAKYLAAEAAWEAGNACIDCHGGYGYAEEYDVERKFRECRLYKTAPVNNNLVLAYVGEHVLGCRGAIDQDRGGAIRAAHQRCSAPALSAGRFLFRLPRNQFVTAKAPALTGGTKVS